MYIIYARLVNPKLPFASKWIKTRSLPVRATDLQRIFPAV